MSYIILYVPCSNKKEALNISRYLLQQKLAGCANIIENMTSLYEWNDNIQENTECLLLLKTKKVLLGKAQEEITNLHSYKTPCIGEIALESLNSSFAAWLERQCLISS